MPALTANINVRPELECSVLATSTAASGKILVTNVAPTPVLSLERQGAFTEASRYVNQLLAKRRAT
jgi:hypothetical protein